MVFFRLYRPIGIPPTENSAAFPEESQLRQSRATQNYGACWVFLVFFIIHRMDCGIFIVRRDVNACDCTRECTDTVRESALKVDSERKIPCRNGESNLPRRRASPMLYQLSYFSSRTHTPSPPPSLAIIPYYPLTTPPSPPQKKKGKKEKKKETLGT